jgi:adenylate kinase
MQDDVTGEPLEQRSDDSAETLRKRIVSFRELTAPLTEYYRKAGVLKQIDASQPPEDVWQSLLQALV